MKKIKPPAENTQADTVKKTPRGKKPPLPEAEGVSGDTRPFPIVGVGASAGGLAAFESFFSGMPSAPETGMAFVLVQHLAPDHKSILTDIISRFTRMSVFEVVDGMEVMPNCIYIIPPGYDMAILNGVLQLLEPSNPRGQRMPIDFFFRSLAQDRRERAIGIVLSGTGSDGTLGVRSIKGEGGMIMAQDPESAEYDGMPRSVIATGLVDYELTPAEMPPQLVSYAARALGKIAPVEAGPAPGSESELKKIFILLRGHVGHDFSLYKRSTIHRRIERRMAVHQIETMRQYGKFLQETPDEIDALYRDLLIGVTSFFRDAEAFKALDEWAIAKLLAGKNASDTVRVWVPGCATGEEAYSIAMLLQERVDAQKKSCAVQVFATDIDGQAIALARGGVYPASIAADLAPERLKRFFTPEPDGNSYHVHKNIRDMLVFSEQDLIRDPPFSKLDLISCRNLLIYMGGELQKKIIPLFHYALNPGGFLFLGTSETVGEAHDLFAVVERKLKLYQRKDDIHSANRALQGRIITPVATAGRTGVPLPGMPAKSSRIPLRELTEAALLQQVAPAGALITAQGDILYLHGRTGRFLEPAPGEAGVNNILKMAREGLRSDLAAALRKVAVAGEIVRCPGLRIKTNGDTITVELILRPVAVYPPAPGRPSAVTGAPLFLAVFLESPQEVCAEERRTEPSGEQTGDSDSRIEDLRRELRAKEEYLQTANEELETSNEELKSSNEEMQSVNEELQSTNEELETSKEELQSVNEELTTVNAELQNKLDELSRANNDMNNLLAGTGIATVFVDHALRIMRFTPAATRIINLIHTDVGRPVGHLASNLAGNVDLTADVQAVLDTLITREAVVRSTGGDWYAMRIQPYRTVENVIEGAVVTFTDVTALKKAEDLSRLAVVVRDSNDAVTVQDPEGRILAWNPAAERMYGWSEAEALSMNVRDLGVSSAQIDVRSVAERLIRAGALEPYRIQRITKNGNTVDVMMTASALKNEAGEVYAIATTERAISRDKGADTHREEETP